MRFKILFLLDDVLDEFRMMTVFTTFGFRYSKGTLVNRFVELCSDIEEKQSFPFYRS